jgi:protein-L-isoaspartate(D-aspartate) O-methyltransferase
MNADLLTDRFTLQRREMVEEQLRRRGIEDEAVLRAMSKVPRHLFVAPEYAEQAYEDHPIPIGEGQTISQPYIVASMLASLSLNPSDVVLEIGTGSGYQTALLAEIVQQVYSIERLPELAESAKKILDELDYKNATVIVGDGTTGLPDFAPFDAIIVSAAAPGIPQPLFDQLREAGRMIIPVGPSQAQDLLLISKQDGLPVTHKLEACRFVPLIGEEGYKAGW